MHDKIRINCVGINQMQRPRFWSSFHYTSVRPFFFSPYLFPDTHTSSLSKIKLSVRGLTSLLSAHYSDNPAHIYLSIHCFSSRYWDTHNSLHYSAYCRHTLYVHVQTNPYAQASTGSLNVHVHNMKAHPNTNARLFSIQFHADIDYPRCTVGCQPRVSFINICHCLKYARAACTKPTLLS